MISTCTSRSTEKYILQIGLLLLGLLGLVPWSFAGEWGFKIQDAATGQGALVTGVSQGTPAAVAGLRKGDIIVEAAGKTVASAKELVKIVKAFPAEKPLSLRVSHSGWKKKLKRMPTRKLVAKPERLPGFGLEVVDQSPSEEPGFGARITTVTPGGWAATAGFKPGDVITQAQGKKIVQAKDLVAVVKGVPPGQQLQLTKTRVRHWKDLAEAEEYFRRLLEHDPHDQDDWHSLVLFLKEQGKFGKARELLKHAIQLAPQKADSYYLMGDVYFAEKNWQQAERYFRLSLERNPESDNAWCDLGSALHNQGRYQEAVEAYHEGLQFNPNHALALLNLGKALRELGKESEAVAHLEKAAQLDPRGEVGEEARLRHAQVAWGKFVRGEGPPPGAREDRLKAMVAVGDFQIKVADADDYVGDGLREMLLTALHNSGYFIVVERMDMEGLAAEQALSRTDMARPDSALPEGQMDVAEILVSGAVTEFEPDKGIWIPSLIGQAFVAQRWGESHMAIDLRVVNAASGRVLAEKRIPGLAISFKASIAGGVSVSGVALPVSLGMYRNTPMEYAIRDCIQKAAMHVVNNIPKDYYRYR